MRTRAEFDHAHPVMKTFMTTHVGQAFSRDEVREAARETVRPLSQLRGALEAAGAPVTMAALGVDGDEARELFLVARDMRARYTVLDLAWDLGLLEGLRDEVLELSGVLR